MKIKINNYEINTKDLTTLFPPSKYIITQMKLNTSVINLYSAMSFEPYERYIKRFWAILYNTKYLIVYDDPNDADNPLVKKAVSFAFKKGITVFYRSRENCNSGLKPSYTELVRQTSTFFHLPGGNVEYMGSYYTEAPEEHKYKVIPERTKERIKRYIRYYEITYPVTEYDWYIAFKQVVYYHKNKIPFAFDKNLYYICPECKELVRRDDKHNHICYCEIPTKRTHMDYVLNGEL